MVNSGDPVGMGLVASLAREPAVLSNPTDPVAVPQLKELESAARIGGVELRVLEVRTLADIERAFPAAAKPTYSQQETKL